MHAFANIIRQPPDGENVCGTVQSERVIRIKTRACKHFLVNGRKPRIVSLKTVNRCHQVDDTSRKRLVASADRDQGSLKQQDHEEKALYWNKSGARAVRFRRHTIQVCAPGVSMSVNFTSFDFNQLLKSRFILIRPSRSEERRVGNEGKARWWTQREDRN